MNNFEEENTQTLHFSANGRQCTIELPDEATSDEFLEALIEIAKFATYSEKSIEKAILALAQEITEELEEDNRDKSDYVSMTLHELEDIILNYHGVDKK